MNNDKYTELIGRLNQYLNADGTGPSVSPKSSGRGHEPLPDSLLITKDLKFEQLDTMTLYLVHTLLHQFYEAGRNKFLTINEMKDLHEKIRGKINHVEYDGLDY